MAGGSKVGEAQTPQLGLELLYVLVVLESVFDALLQKPLHLNIVLNLQCRHRYCFWKKLCKTSQMAILI